MSAMTSTTSPASGHVERSNAQLESVRVRLREHRLYRMIQSPAALRTFVEHHVICVLDFMSLLKSLQRDFTCIDVPWLPPEDPKAARLVQQIVLDEECDLLSDGKVLSHFEWYVQAMEEIGADTKPIHRLVEQLASGVPWISAIEESGLPVESCSFGLATGVALKCEQHIRAAVFFHGREEVIPEMFSPIVERLAEEGLSCSTLQAYLKRHIELDSGEHGPACKELLQRMYESQPSARSEAEDAALQALIARERLWDAIAIAIDDPR
jgi:hypothetical protein